jgi:ubiquinone/menaquinone biosynthesis C-methylase UbiE
MAFSHERDIGHFDRWAPRYDRSWAQWIFFRPLYRRALGAAEALAPDPERVLDVGCGTGGFLRLAADRFPAAALTGVDPSEVMLAYAVAVNPAGSRLTFVHATAEALPFAEGFFDLAVSTMSFHHWADQAKGLQEIARVLRPGAALLLADHFVIRSHRLLYAAPGTKERFHPPATIDEMLSGAGFAASEWRLLYRIGPFPIVAAVTARRGVSV